MDLKENKDREYSCTYEITLYNNALFFNSSSVIDKNIMKRFVLSKEIFQIKGLVNHLRNIEFFISTQSNWFDGKVLSYIDEEYDLWLENKVSDEDILSNIVSYAKSLKKSNSSDNKKYIELEDMIQCVKLKGKDSKKKINDHYKDIKGYISFYPELSLNYSQLDKAANHNFNKILMINLLYHNVFHYNDLLEYLKIKGLSAKIIKKEKEQLNLF